MVDTACSSSLVALDQACQVLRQNQSTVVSFTLYFAVTVLFALTLVLVYIYHTLEYSKFLFTP